MPFEPQRLSLLLCLLLACAQTSAPLGDKDQEGQEEVAAQGVVNDAMASSPASAWRTTGSMADTRTGHTATLLPDGRVLVVGGISSRGYLATAEVYAPAIGTWSSTGSLKEARAHHTATLLLEGKVFVAGGFSGLYPAMTEVYEPATGTWTTTGRLHQARAGHTATLLPHGKVILLGGGNGSKHTPTIEVYDPSVDRWDALSSAGELTRSRTQHTTTLLADGRVLVAGGGESATAEVYEPATGIWSPTASMTETRHDHTATLLPGGKVLVVGGNSSNSTPLATAEVYEPPLAAWFFTDSLGRSPSHHTATLLSNGNVLVVGGYANTGPLANAELYDPATGTWSSAGELMTARTGHTATLLSNGNVLVVGGYASPSLLANAELYDPVMGTWSSAGELGQARRGHSATLLSDGNVLVVGGDSNSGAAATAELYNPGTGKWSLTGAPSRVRKGHTSTMLPDGKVLIAGGRNGGSLFATAEVYDPDTGAWSSTGSLRKARAYHSATLLSDGKVLVVSGASADGSAELYVEDSAGASAWRPSITVVSPHSWEPGSLLRVTGNGLGDHGTNFFPSLSLLSVENGLWVTLQKQHASSTSMTATHPLSLPSGYYLLNATRETLTASSILLVSNITPPETVLGSSTPAPVTLDTIAIFSFKSAAVDLASFECSLDMQAFLPCTSPHHYNPLLEGKHTFKVRARDIAGNVDPTPAEYHWTVSSPPANKMGCTAGGASGWAWPWTLLLLGLPRRGRRH